MHQPFRLVLYQGSEFFCVLRRAGSLLVPGSDHIPSCTAILELGLDHVVQRIALASATGMTFRNHNGKTKVLILQGLGGSRSRPDDLRPPYRERTSASIKFRESWLPRNSRNQRKVSRRVQCNLVLIAAFSGPLRDAAAEIDRAVAYLPSFV